MQIEVRKNHSLHSRHKRTFDEMLWGMKDVLWTVTRVLWQLPTSHTDLFPVVPRLAVVIWYLSTWLHGVTTKKTVNFSHRRQNLRRWIMERLFLFVHFFFFCIPKLLTVFDKILYYGPIRKPLQASLPSIRTTCPAHLGYLRYRLKL